MFLFCCSRLYHITCRNYSDICCCIIQENSMVGATRGQGTTILKVMFLSVAYNTNIFIYSLLQFTFYLNNYVFLVIHVVFSLNYVHNQLFSKICFFCCICYRQGPCAKGEVTYTKRQYTLGIICILSETQFNRFKT